MEIYKILKWVMLTSVMRALVKETKNGKFVLNSAIFELLKNQIYHFSPFFNTIFLNLSS